jgi:hypothetical protein
MSGDQSEYLRGKIAQRGINRSAKFMTDGFDRWAESEAPARSGQMDKMPAEATESYGGAMTVHQAKKHLGGAYSSKMHGGDLLATGKKIVQEAQNLINFWRGVSSWLGELKGELVDEVIENPQAPASYVNTAKNFLAVLESLDSMKNVLDDIAKAASLVGLGKPSKMHGGAMTLEDLGKYAGQVAGVYNWLRQNKPGIQGILNLKSFNAGAANGFGGKVWSAIEPFFKAIGLGRKVGGKKCCCDEYSGSALPVLDVNAMEIKKPRKVGGKKLEISLQRIAPSDQHDAMLGGRKKSPRKAQLKELKELVVGGKKSKVSSKKPSARGEIVKKVMREQGLSLPQASKYVKEHNLYRP